VSSTVPSVHCDCRQKSVRNVRIIAVVVSLCGIILREAVFAGDVMAKGICGVVVGLAFVTYGVATMFDESATFPKLLYAAFALAGALLTALWGSSLL
jgi:hypothetical protein